MEVENKHFDVDIKSVGDDGIIEGYGSVFGNVDSDGDIVALGAFVKSISKKKPMMLWQHDTREVIGMWDEVREDSKGLFVKGRLFKDDIPRAKEAYTLLKEGAISGMSIGFVTKQAVSDDRKNRIITEADLWEVSIVTFPANDRATVTRVKAAGIETVRDLERALRDAGYSKAASRDVASRFMEKRRDAVSEVSEKLNELSDFIKSLTGDQNNGRSRNQEID